MRRVVTQVTPGFEAYLRREGEVVREFDVLGHGRKLVLTFPGTGLHNFEIFERDTEVVPEHTSVVISARSVEIDPRKAGLELANSKDALDELFRGLALGGYVPGAMRRLTLVDGRRIRIDWTEDE